jgi:hypothetical protein
MGEPKTMHDVKSMSRLAPPMRLRTEIDRALLLSRLASERRRIERELALGRQRQRSLEARRDELDAQIVDIETRRISQPIRTGIGPPLSADIRQHLTLEY